jgi:hypothetical protein
MTKRKTRKEQTTIYKTLHRKPSITRFVLVHDLSPGLYSFMTYHQVCNKSNMTGATCGAGTAYPFKAPEFTPGFQWGSKGKQGTKGLKQIEEENKGTLNFYFYIILGVNVS